MVCLPLPRRIYESPLMNKLEKALAEAGYSTIARIQKRLLNFTIDENGCWRWNGYLTEHGYGRIHWQKDAKAHRVMYQLIYGKLDREQVLDHLCRVHDCVNPRHLEPVTNYENLRRGESWKIGVIRKTHCKFGHEFTPDNTISYVNIHSGLTSRNCRICCRRRDLASWRKRNNRSLQEVK